MMGWILSERIGFGAGIDWLGADINRFRADINRFA
jgi:hypothetical protein